MATVPYLILTDDDGNAYNFPISFWLKDEPFSVNSAIQKLAYFPGGKDISDFSPKERTLTIEGYLQADTVAAFETAIRNLSLAILKGGKLSISNDYVSRYIDVRNPQVTNEWEYYPRFKNISITFSVDFPFWEDASEQSEDDIFAGNDSLVVTVTGSDYVIFPVIQIDADQAADLPGVKLRNLDDGGVTCEYNDPGFVAGDSLIIDCKEGTVKKNGNNTIAYFNPGVFLRLQPGSNTIEYEGNACTLTVTYRRVYAL